MSCGTVSRSTIALLAAAGSLVPLIASVIPYEQEISTEEHYVTSTTPHLVARDGLVSAVSREEMVQIPIESVHGYMAITSKGLDTLQVFETDAYRHMIDLDVKDTVRKTTYNKASAMTRLTNFFTGETIGNRRIEYEIVH